MNGGARSTGLDSHGAVGHEAARQPTTEEPMEIRLRTLVGFL